MINMVLESQKVQEKQYLNFAYLLENILKGIKSHIWLFKIWKKVFDNVS